MVAGASEWTGPLGARSLYGSAEKMPSFDRQFRRVDDSKAKRECGVESTLLDGTSKCLNRGGLTSI